MTVSQEPTAQPCAPSGYTMRTWFLRGVLLSYRSPPQAKVPTLTPSPSLRLIKTPPPAPRPPPWPRARSGAVLGGESTRCPAHRDATPPPSPRLRKLRQGKGKNETSELGAPTTVHTAQTQTPQKIKRQRPREEGAAGEPRSHSTTARRRAPASPRRGRRARHPRATRPRGRHAPCARPTHRGSALPAGAAATRARPPPRPRRATQFRGPGGGGGPRGCPGGPHSPVCVRRCDLRCEDL